MGKRTVLIYARSNGGKTTQLGELAEYVYKTEGKKSRIYTADRGGVDPLLPYIKLGIVEVVDQGNSDPFIFLNKAARGMVRDAQGKWVAGDNANIGMFAFESLTSFADALMEACVRKISDGVNIGGGANISFSVQGDGETIKVGGSNVALFGVVQNRITGECWESMKLPASYVVWTASASRDEDQNAGGKVIGPAVIGKALTAEVPRWFQYTFRLDCIPAQMGKPERHILYLGNSVDPAAGNAVGLGNTRVPLGVTLPPTIEPASVVAALKLIDEGSDKVLDTIKKRLSM